MAQKITPNLWLDGNAREAVDFYVSVFPGSKITGGMKYPTTKEEGLADSQLDMAGKDLTISFTLAGHDLLAINAGSEFRPTPANSFMVNFDLKGDPEAREHLNQVWEKLIDGGEALMELGEYPFSKYYGGVKDKYGYTWQLILPKPEGEARPCIIPSLAFTRDVYGRAEEALTYYTSVFKDAKIGTVAKYQEDSEMAKKGTVMFSDFNLDGEWFTAMDAGGPQNYTFTEAVSYSIACKDQAEIDYFWEKLSAVPESEQCGWCKDKFGVSWQIVPENMVELMQRPGAFARMMQMHKLEIDKF